MLKEYAKCRVLPLGILTSFDDFEEEIYNDYVGLYNMCINTNINYCT